MLAHEHRKAMTNTHAAILEPSALLLSVVGSLSISSSLQEMVAFLFNTHVCAHQGFLAARRLPHTQLEGAHTRLCHPSTVTVLARRLKSILDHPVTPT